jgi:DNA-binding response OmpR family regulator
MQNDPHQIITKMVVFTTNMNLLIIEDDESVAKTIERSLRSNYFNITITSNGYEGLKSARKLPPDLIILDIIMPGLDGYKVCKEIRSDPILNDVPIMFLTAKVSDEDKIAGFLAGADDYLIKPFNIDELALRIHAILRRISKRNTSKELAGFDILKNINRETSTKYPESSLSHEIVVGEYTLDVITYELNTPNKGKIRLTPVQYDLLFHMMTHTGEIFSPARLLDEVWDYPANAGSPDLVRVHIKNLRERVEADPKKPLFIQTVTGFGYTILKEKF